MSGVQYYVAAFGVIFASLSLNLGTLQSSSKMHREALHSVLRGPMSIFDTMPIGRILNRFSADVDTLDNKIPQTLTQCLSSMFRVSLRSCNDHWLSDNNMYHTTEANKQTKIKQQLQVFCNIITTLKNNFFPTGNTYENY